MPWATTGFAATSLCRLSPPRSVAHDAGSPAPYASFKTPADTALRVRLRALLPSMDPALHALLFVDMHSVTDVRRALAALPARVQPSHWLPAYDTPEAYFERDSDTYALYTALVSRVNALEHYASALRTLVSSSRAMTVSSSSNMDRLCALAHYMHAWLDAHLLAALALDDVAEPPADDSETARVVFGAFAPSWRTYFHEGALPDISRIVESCSFFTSMTPPAATKPVSETETAVHALQQFLNKTIPRRCGVRNVMSHFEVLFAKHDAIAAWTRAITAASLLGVYRHARDRPAVRERMRLYRFFFYDPADDVRRVLVRYTEPTCATASAYMDARLAARLPATATETGVSATEWARRASMYAAIVEKDATDAKTFVFQNTLVVTVRECVVFVLQRLLPHVHEELCARTSWHKWQASVIDCMDTMRAMPPSPTSVLRHVTPATLPVRSLYSIELQPFTEAMHAACTTLLDAGESTANDADGSELPLNAMFIPELEYVLRHLVKQYGHASALEPVVDVPRIDSADGDDWLGAFRREFVAHRRFPLTLFYATAETVAAYNDAVRLYQVDQVRAAPRDFALYLAKTAGMYQFLVVAAFVQAQVDASRVYAVPLAHHIAEKQAAALRRRFSLPPEAPLPRHVLSTFVCLQCREFRGALVRPSGKRADGSMYGSEHVAVQRYTLTRRVAETLARTGFPTYDACVREAQAVGGTLFAYYRAHATIDAATSIYPHDCTAFDAPPDALDVARTYVQRIADDDPSPFSLTGLDDDAIALAPLTPPARKRAHVALDALESPLGQSHDAYARFLERWQMANGRRFLCGHRSSDPRDDMVLWTCAFKKYKVEERKTRQTVVAERKIANSITPMERQQAQRSANFRRRRDVRLYYHYSLCSRTHVTAVSMLGTLVRIDNTLIVACCGCLAYTEIDNASWSGDELLCCRCILERQHGRETLQPSALTTARTCFSCACACPPSAARFTAFDETRRAFVDVYLCARHARKKSWIFTSPLILSLQTIETGISANWSALRSWDAARVSTMATSRHTTMSSSAVMRMARAHAGHVVFDEDAVDDDDDVPVAPVLRRRRVAADSRQRAALVT